VLTAGEVREAIARQARAHGVDLARHPGVRGLVANVAQVILGEWGWEHQELCRLRDFRTAMQLAAGSGTTVATAYAELAELERFYAKRRAIDEDGA